MARRAASLSKPQVSAHKTATALVSGQPAAATPRRGKQVKLPEMPAAAMSVADAFFPGGEEVPAVSGTDPATSGKVRRKPKVQPAPKSPSMGMEPARELSASTKDPTYGADGQVSDTIVGSPGKLSASSRRTRRDGQNQIDAHLSASTDTSAAPQARPASAAKWNAETGTATFDWPGIEHVASTEGPNQAMAKLLLAARAEGANSRWPF